MKYTHCISVCRQTAMGMNLLQDFENCKMECNRYKDIYLRDFFSSCFAVGIYLGIKMMKTMFSL